MTSGGGEKQNAERRAQFLEKKNILNPQLVPSVSYMHSCSKLLIANLKKDLLPGEEICLQYGTELLHILVSPLLVLFLFV
jgi:hypothetical protein